MMKSIFLILFCSFYFIGQDQYASQTLCGNELKVLKVTNSTSNLSNGKIEVSIISKSSFTCSISKIKNGNFEKIQEKEYSGNQKVVFEDLLGKEYYRISVFFKNVENIECSQLDAPSIAVY